MLGSFLVCWFSSSGEHEAQRGGNGVNLETIYSAYIIVCFLFDRGRFIPTS